jgi:hypothetical protein
MKRGSVKGVLSIARKEIRKSRNERIIEEVLLVFALLTVSLLLVFLSAKLLITGYASYIEAKGGYVTELNITRKFDTYYWGGLYGIAYRIPGFTEQLPTDVTTAEVDRHDLFFDCIQDDAVGGTEVYASTSPTILWETIQAANPADVDDYMGCISGIQCAQETFTLNGSIMLGASNITGVPFTYTYQYDGNQNTFNIGILNDSENIVFVTNRVAVQRGYNYEKIVNYQMMLPTPENSTVTYYFFTDPYDECPAGADIGTNVNSTMYGYVFHNSTGIPLDNVTVNIAGYETLTDSSGFYNLSFLVSAPGNYNAILTKTGYDPSFGNVSINFSYYIVEQNFTMSPETPSYLNESINPYVYGYVFDESGFAVSEVNVSLGTDTYTTNSTGFYELSPLLIPGKNPIIAVKTGYDNYYAYLELNESITYNHNITLIVAEDVIYLYPTGPYTTGPYSTGPYTQPPNPVVIAEKRGEDYWISSKEINKEVRQNTFVEEEVGIYNFQYSTMNLVYSLSPNLADFVKLDKTSGVVEANSYGSIIVTIYGIKPLGKYNGTLTISGDIEKEIPINIEIVEKRFPVETLLMEFELFKRIVRPGETLDYKLNLQNLLRDQGYKVDLRVYVTDANKTEVYAETEEEAEIVNSLTLLRDIEIPYDAPEGDYLLNADAIYLNYISTATTPFVVSKPIYLYSFFGIPLWIIFIIISFISFILLNVFIYRKYKEKKKRYRIMLDFGSLPKPGDRVVRLGKVAETNVDAHYEIDKLTTHCIVAGATGMGKSISAQVIIEEALMQNIAVVVFDPTAQWSGMLRKCDDKKMMSYYPKFGLKETDARAFKGSVRQVKNAREVIDVQKYIIPGHIQVFTLNKLDPKDIDVFVASVIRQIFRSDPKESPNLKMILVFDEVHRLLSKFGGSGQGFLQVERACREFRKWGLGVVLISQVLNDFVGEIKANINTEVQTRTLEEGDLDRIKTKYGEEFLKSLVRAEVGVAMFQNAEYNRGKPYFINFRPILHNTRRLSDEELDKYNKYNEIVDDLEYQIEQLEKEKVDAFDLKMELKLVKDKIMTGNFSVVEIYLEGLVPRIQKEWEKLGKKPKKREIKLVAEEEIKKSVEEAKKSREKFEKQEAKNKPEEKKQEKKEKPEDKELNPMTFDNGVMIGRLKELRDVLPNMDAEIFKVHVNEQKNDIAEWIKQLSPEFAENIKGTLDKGELVQKIDAFIKLGGKMKAEEKPEEKKEEGKKEEKKPVEEKKEEKKEEGKKEGE